MSYKPDRFARAVHLVLTGKVQRLGGGKYQVAGNKEEFYDVDLTADITCYCADMEYRGTQIKQQCKHHLAARLAGLDPALVQVLADRIEREAKEAEASKPRRARKEQEAA